MEDLFPAIDPYDSGMLPVGDGQQIYWECVGNRNGAPVVYLHGGPGAGCSPGQRRLFDPERYRAILFDQRGSGRSVPLASNPDYDLRTNTTQHLIADLELLRIELGIERWGVVGMSWGTTLGLAYAHQHPTRVTALILAFVTATTRREVEWITRDVGRIFPREWERFSQHVPEHLRELPLVDAYAELLNHPDTAIHEPAALEWCIWEDAHMSLTPGHEPWLRYQDPEFRLRFARLVTHYWRNAAFLDDRLLRRASDLNGIPGVLIHGLYDISGPLETAWRLHQKWKTSELHILDDAGHGGGTSLYPLLRGALRRLILKED